MRVLLAPKLLCAISEYYHPNLMHNQTYEPKKTLKK